MRYHPFSLCLRLFHDHCVAGHQRRVSRKHRPNQSIGIGRRNSKQDPRIPLWPASNVWEWRADTGESDDNVSGGVRVLLNQGKKETYGEGRGLMRVAMSALLNWKSVWAGVEVFMFRCLIGSLIAIQ